ncbi:hypothetical protein J32TS6_11840 [Virgibacillus pantothenticus]|uniref:hypothetical protein n=1 Tax=Virgibacillus TaxID=84406 RepID=UPI0009560395|nr:MULTISPECIES: hypothetical protein [Virgibacillus]MED3738257.1 hypothetical protein [Virgibacillus pantothenticus]GIP62629.1 hypothetical protein J32TS6_11840 [Virgibacillus pantothenticus]SIS77316.1 hypothetical protein SAMN05421787_10389 [Virgibacillus pantothenticus]
MCGWRRAYHGPCLEGLASGTAMEKRYGMKADLLAEHNYIWEIEAYYLGSGINELLRYPFTRKNDTWRWGHEAGQALHYDS